MPSEENEAIDLKHLKNKLLTFLILIYSNFNIARSDADKINEKLFCLLVEPLLHQFNILGKQLDHDAYLKIFNFSAECKLIFESLKSEYLLKKTLMENDLMQPL